MKVNGRLKKWTVDNRCDKDGAPNAVIIMTYEVKFEPMHATALGKLTTAEAVSLEIQKSQIEMEI